MELQRAAKVQGHWPLAARFCLGLTLGYWKRGTERFSSKIHAIRARRDTRREPKSCDSIMNDDERVTDRRVSLPRSFVPGSLL